MRRYIQMLESEYLTVAQVALKLQLHPKTVRRLLKAGKLPGKRLGSRQWRIYAEDLRAHLTKGRCP